MASKRLKSQLNAFLSKNGLPAPAGWRARHQTRPGPALPAINFEHQTPAPRAKPARSARHQPARLAPAGPRGLALATPDTSAGHDGHGRAGSHASASARHGRRPCSKRVTTSAARGRTATGRRPHASATNCATKKRIAARIWQIHKTLVNIGRCACHNGATCIKPLQTLGRKNDDKATRQRNLFGQTPTR